MYNRINNPFELVVLSTPFQYVESPTEDTNRQKDLNNERDQNFDSLQYSDISIVRIS